MKLDINRLNDKLAEHNQLSKVTFYSANPRSIIVNNITYIGNDAIRIIRRINGDIHWVENFDRIYLLCELNAVQSVRSSISAKGGLACQKMHSEKIKENLNTGIPWNKDTKGSYLYSSWCKGKTKYTDARLRALSLNRKGINNPMAGKSMSPEAKASKSKIMRQKILDGTFTPNSNNRNTHWDSYFEDKRFRSSWEAIYYSLHIEALYESLRIPYTYNNKDHVYIVDFINHATKEVIEIKPKELLLVGNMPAKLAALYNWANCAGYSVCIVTQDDIHDMATKVDLTKFDINTQKKIKVINETYTAS